jgi:glycosyltransferase involved in cell wall biosynthesis
MTAAGDGTVAARTGDTLLTVVAPVFNEEDIVDELVERLQAASRQASTRFELVLVNDGSRDNTLARLLVLTRTVPELRVINLQRNFGHMAAITAGLARARGDAVVVLDGDLQDPPELIPEFVAKWKEGADVVYGLRTRRHEALNRRLQARLFYLILARFSSTPIPRSTGTYGLLDRQVLATLNLLPERSRFFAGLRAWVGGKQVSVEYDRPERPHGKSRVGYAGQWALALTAFTAFSKAPLRLASLFSVVMGLGLFAVGVSAILIKLLTGLQPPPGWATFATLLGIVGFAQSMVLAVLAEYVSVIFDEVKLRPLFLIREEFAHGEVVAEAGRSDS